jgi:hypothetical protein
MDFYGLYKIDAKGSREENGILRDDGQLGPQVVQAKLADVQAVDADGTLGWFDQSKQRHL